MRVGRVQRSRTKVNLPPGALAVIADAKDHYHLTLLTVNSMPPSLTARVQAQDQLAASRVSLRMEAGEFFFFFLLHVLTAVEFGNT
jgi:hypothetical protein